MASQIFRYKFSDQFLQEMLAFIEVHRLDDIPVFNESWKKWIEDHLDLYLAEHRRLKNIGYEGDILLKMYKSARYYFKNKEITEKAPKKRRNYIRIDKNILSQMDTYIETVKRGKPALLYQNFAIQYKTILDDLKKQLLEKGLNKEEVALKFKKTFKNRYFKFISK